MALITCPECGNKVSSEAMSCPHCGYPLKKFSQPCKSIMCNEISNKRIGIKSKKARLLCVALIIAFILGFLIYFIIACLNKTVTDICGNTYPVVKIGEQYWMAENMRCNRYDTNSEAFNAFWLANNTVFPASSADYTPYCIDATDKTRYLSPEKCTEYLSSSQIAKLGYLYNWAAAVGVEDGQNQTSAFTGNRQGICPNGWHVPSKADWETLYDYIYNEHNLSENEVGKYLKSTTGWHMSGNGIDSYGFAGLPADFATNYASDVSVIAARGDAAFWTVTPTENNINFAYYMNLSCINDDLTDSTHGKYLGLSVRCLKD